jgi:hypothetical protein
VSYKLQLLNEPPVFLTALACVINSQMETIVQLQEVAEDIDWGLREMPQATGSLTQTTRALQSNVKRTQMRPCAVGLVMPPGWES